MSTLRPGRTRRVLINAFLIFHIVSVICWSLPLQYQPLTAWRSLVRPYFVWSGLFQTWDMFAPAPKSINSYVDAIVIHTSGQAQSWTFPRMDELSLTERYFKERYRKFEENLTEEKNSILWPDAARFVARVNSTSADPVTRVYLVHHWSEITPFPGPSSNPKRWQEKMFFRYVVEPGDLK